MEEVLRFRTLVPLGVQHATTESVQIGNYVLPKGTMVSAVVSLRFIGKRALYNYLS